MNDLATKFKALADPARLAIIHFLKNPSAICCLNDDGICACDVENFLKLTQSTVSHHMKILVQAGFIIAQKRGRFVYYELDPNSFQAVIATLTQCCISDSKDSNCITNSMTLVDEGIPKDKEVTI